MSKKTFMATIIILAFFISPVAGLYAVQVAKANPYEPPPFYPPAPTKDLPTIFVVSPTNATYHQNNITLNIFIIQPSSWQQGNMTVGYVRDVFYTIDGRTNILWDQMYNPPPRCRKSQTSQRNWITSQQATILFY